MLQVMNQPIEFRIFNTVTLNNILLFIIASTATSYLTVLLQYDLENQKELGAV